MKIFVATVADEKKKGRKEGGRDRGKKEKKVENKERNNLHSSNLKLQIFPVCSQLFHENFLSIHSLLFH